MTNTNVITIRAAEPDDFAAVQAVYAQPNAYRGTLQMPYPSAEQWRARLANQAAGRTVLVAVLDECIVGNIGLAIDGNIRRRHAGSIGMGVHDDFAGRGVGTELLAAALDLADNWHNLRRVELTVFADNERAINLYRRLGFIEEGRLKDYAFRDGEYVDALYMARLNQA